MRTESVTLVLADHDPLARKAVREAMVARHGLIVVAEAVDTQAAIEAVLRHGPDIVLLDADLPPLGGVLATAQLLAASPPLRVILFSVGENTAAGIAGLQAGASGVLAKDIDMSALARAIRGVAQGEAAISRRLTSRVIDQLRQLGGNVRKMRPLRSQLTDRQWEVLDLAAEGRSRAEIAEILEVSVDTVRAHTRTALSCLHVETLQEALEEAARLRSGGT